MSKHVFSHSGKGRYVSLGAPALTLYEDLGDFGVTGAESTVDLKAICVVEEGAAQREEDFLGEQEQSYPTGAGRWGVWWKSGCSARLLSPVIP